MANEAEVYEELCKTDSACGAVPSYLGFSMRYGVAMICLSREGPSFDEIDPETMSKDLKLSAIRSLQRLADMGILHGDVALHNVVQSRDNPNGAKIVDFGRSTFTEDTHALQEQVDELRSLLGVQEEALS